ncbi:MAG: hypothetical protein Q8O43_03415 [Dehalococcoidia bacterium]|nr:hypothetical protein [Dehalococcoidia bacterium]
MPGIGNPIPVEIKRCKKCQWRVYLASYHPETKDKQESWYCVNSTVTGVVENCPDFSEPPILEEEEQV